MKIFRKIAAVDAENMKIRPVGRLLWLALNSALNGTIENIFDKMSFDAFQSIWLNWKHAN